jgi:hypothetical protein
MDQYKDTGCYGIHCDNLATTKLRLSISRVLSCEIYVCNSCLSKFVSNADNQNDEQVTS